MPKRTILLLTLVLVLLAAACGSDGAEGVTTVEDTAPVTTTTPVETTEPVEDPAPSLTVQDGDTVEVHYVGTLDDGEQFDSSRDRDETFSFTVASGQVISGFDDAVRGLKVGEIRVYTIPAEDAYGEYSEDNFLELPYGPSQGDVAVGDQVFLSATGQPVIILEVREDTVLVDANHRLAGEALTFEVEIISITRPEPSGG